MISVEVVPTGDTAIERDDDFTHLVCRYDVPVQGPVTDPTVRALCGRNMDGDSFGVTGQICVVCKDMARRRPTTCPRTSQPCGCVPYDYSSF
jgi:hypothetical protein